MELEIRKHSGSEVSLNFGSPVHNVLAVSHKVEHGSWNLSGGFWVVFCYADADELICL